MLRKLILLASLAVACQAKPDLPSSAKRLARDRANPLIIFGNGSAAERLLKMRSNGPPMPSFGR